MALVYSGIYFGRIRTQLIRASNTNNGDAEWVQHLRWYDRLNYARRSPARWAQAARRWWTWLIVVALAAGLVIEQLIISNQPGAYRPGFGFLFLEDSFWAVAALGAAARAGFWYAEHMRLTGRRPERGGRLLPRAQPPGTDAPIV